uniref:Uncharacterized protein n=1 Tax=Strigamia maritima TaxID=126957 RepID=T1J423_STRMM
MEETRLSVTPLLPHLGQLADLHVYVVPVECWASSQKLLCSFVMQEAVSYGFVRVQTKVILHDLRIELEEQLEKDVLPEEYVFLKSVGRNFARVKEKQEYQLKVRDFVPPNVSMNGTPDSGTPDSGTPDSGTPDSGTPDSGTPDSGTPDSGTPDSGTPDAARRIAARRIAARRIAARRIAARRIAARRIAARRIAARRIAARRIAARRIAARRIAARRIAARRIAARRIAASPTRLPTCQKLVRLVITGMQLFPMETASEPELYLLEIIPEVQGNQSDKQLNRGRTRSELVSPSHLPTLTSPVNDLSTPSGVLSGSPTTILLPPVSPGAKATGVSSKNRATSSTGLVAVDSEVKLPSIQLQRPKSESQVKNGRDLKLSSKKSISHTQSVVPLPPPPPPPPPPPIPPMPRPHLPSRIPVSRSRTGKGTLSGRRVSVTANVLKRRHYTGRPSAIIAYQRIIVPNGRKTVIRSTALSDVAEESEGGETPLVPMRVEGPESLRQRTSFGSSDKAVQKVLDSSQESTDEDIRQLEVATLSSDVLEDLKSEEEKATGVDTSWISSDEEQQILTVIDRNRLRRRKVSSSGALRPVSNLDIRSAQQAAILKYELTVSELKGLRHAACHTSEQTNRPIMYRRIRPIPRTVWYPRPLHEGGNPPPALRQTYRRGGRRSKAVRGDAGHAYYTLSNDRRRSDRPHVTFGTRISKKKVKPSTLQGLKTKLPKASPAFQVISTNPVSEEEGNKRVPYSKSKRRKKKVLKEDILVESGSGKEKVSPSEPKVAAACDKSGGGCCDWVIDSVSLEEFVNSEEKRKQVLQPIRKAAQARRKQVEIDAKNKYSASTSEVPQGTVLLCSVDRPH